MSTVTAVPASAGEAMDMVHAGLAYLAAVDATALGSAAQAGCLRGLELANSVATAARTSVLSAFTAGQGYCDDGAFSPRAWLVHQTAITPGAAAGHTGWMKRARAHPRVQAAMAAKEVSEPWARTICEWTGKLPEGSRDAADGILLAAAASGLGLPDLAGLAGEMYERSRQRQPGGSGPDRVLIRPRIVIPARGRTARVAGTRTGTRVRAGRLVSPGIPVGTRILMRARCWMTGRYG